MVALAEETETSTSTNPNETKAQKAPGFGIADFAGALLILMAFVVGSRVIVDNSFLTHLATGRLIIADRSVPAIDPYSYFAAGQPWTVQSWLPSVLYHLINESIGGWGIRVLHGLLTSALMFHLWKLVARAEQLVTRIALAGACVLIGAYLWTPRPLLFGLLGMVLLLRVAHNQLPLVTLLPVMYVWVNSHGSFPLAGVYVVALMFGGWIDTRRVDPKHLRLLGVTSFGILVAAINPVGWRLLWFPVHLLGRREALESVAEWGAPTFTSSYEWVFIGLLGLLLLAARRGASAQALLPAALFSIAALLAVRNLGFASIILVASIAPYLRSLVGAIHGRGKSRVATVGIGAVGVCLSLAMFNAVSTPPVKLDRYPVDEVDWLAKRSLVADEDIRIAQRDFVGNYITFKHGADSKVFVDDRFDFYPQDVLDDHLQLVFGGDYQEIVERREFDVALWESDSAFAYWLQDSEDWSVVMSDEDWIVACRLDSSAAARCR